jgi:hypothetical protein
MRGDALGLTWVSVKVLRAWVRIASSVQDSLSQTLINV